MKNKFRKKLVTAVAVMFSVIMMQTTVFAAGSYSSTYDMTGGVFSRYIQPKSKVTVQISPNVGAPDCNMGVIWAKKYWYGWDGPVKMTSSIKDSSVTFKTTEKRKVWLRNFTGIRWTGEVSFEWD